MKIQVVGIPSHAGALYEGTELAPNAIREAGLIQKLTERGFSVNDMGNLLMETSLPRHNIAPVRNWPAPRMVWEEIEKHTEKIFQKDSFTIILGGDCSIEVGTFHSFQKVFGEDSHLLVLDAHVDTMEPKGDICIGAAGMGLWFLQQNHNPWWKGNPVDSNRISIIGPQQRTIKETSMNILPYEDLNQASINNHLNSISAQSILLHLDVDILHKSIMPAAYAPSEIGIDYTDAIVLLETIMADPRVKAIEVTEFSANNDQDQTCASLIVDLLCLLTKN